MIVYRLCRDLYSYDLSGTGAQLSGGRWNSKGVPVLYTSSSRALAMAEALVHMPAGAIPPDFVMVTISIPEDLDLVEVSVGSLPANWRNWLPVDETQVIGDAFVKGGKHPVMRVPSAVVAGDFNYLVNTMHPDASRIKVTATEPFGFDTRLFKA